MFYAVALCSPPYATLTYIAPEALDRFDWKPGLRVAVPLGSGTIRCGVILSISAENTLISEDKIRPIVWPLEREALFAEDHVRMIESLATRVCITPGRLLGNILPQGLRATERIRLRDFSNARKSGGKPRLIPLGAIPGMDQESIRQLAYNFMLCKADLLRIAEDSADTELCALACDPPWPVRPRAITQRAILDWLMQHGSASRKRLQEELHGCSTALSSLLKKGLIEIRKHDQEIKDYEPNTQLLIPPDPPYMLSAEQVAVLKALANNLESLFRGTDIPKAHLLFGVTGSGKTAVYLELARICMQSGRSAMLLAPEVAIAIKLKRDAEQRFPGLRIYVYHGYQSPALREHIFRTLASSHESCLIIGTRSAIFLPVRNLGAIILDEEHDASFKQEERVPYHAKEAAWERVRRERAILVLGSATPDIKTYYAAMQGMLPVSRMDKRASGGSLPEITVIDIKRQPHSSLLSPESLQALRTTVQKGEQAVILLNRRGYAPVMYCLDCGLPIRCPYCDVAMTYHKKREQMVCHYCGYTKPWPSPCERCGGLNFLPMGKGTEQMEEKLAGDELADILPAGGKILRLDRDSVGRQGQMEEILASFARQEGQVLVGTQMLSKGHHFPNVTLALVADGDMGLNLPDYRSAERTFQLLVQSAGRAGRGKKPGRVLIQSRDTSHYCWEYVRSGDYQSFYEHELEIRRKRRYPPFVKLALVRLSWPCNWTEGKTLTEKISGDLRNIGRSIGCMILGPAPAPIARLQGRLRYQCLIKAQSWKDIRQTYTLALQRLGTKPQNLRITLDIDPVSML